MALLRIKTVGGRRRRDEQHPDGTLILTSPRSALREFIVERLYRDAPLMVIGEGTNDILRTVIARALISGRGTVG